MRGAKIGMALQALVFCFSAVLCINIRGIDRAGLLIRLYNNAKNRGLSYCGCDPNFCMNREKAEEYVGEYIDYLNSRVMKIEVPAAESGNDKLKTASYNLHNGEGAAERIVESMRAGE